MNTSKSSYKRLMSLVLSMLMIVAMLSVSADAVNKYIFVNGKLAVEGKEYNEDVTVTIEGIEDMTGVVVTVNNEAVVLDENGGFEIKVAEGVVEEETADPETADPETADPETADPATADTAKTPATSGAAAEEGKYNIVVTQNGDVISAVNIIVKAKDENETKDPETKDPETKDPETKDPETKDPEKPDTTDPETKDPEKPDTTDPETKDPEKPDTTDPETKDPEKPDTTDPETKDPDTPDPLKPFYGDVNLDGKVTAKDALLAQRYAIKLEKLNDQQLLNGDVNGDGKVTAADALLILRHAVKIINTFPVEAK